MKNLIIILIFSVNACLSGTAQVATNLSDYTDGELVTLSDNEKEYFMNKASYVKDAQGLKSGEILSFHENGNLEESGVLMANKKFGTWKKFSEGGRLIAEANYVNDRKDGIWKVWDENGTLRLQFEYDNGNRVGTWLMYDESGTLVNSESYK